VSVISEGELGPKASGSITIEQLFALNEEIRALVRAGVPLERGLLTAARSLRGRLGRITSALADRLNRGESLVQALESEKQVLPALYRAVVEAGARSGNLPVALEGLARYVRGYSEARAVIGLALWYPLVVLCLAYALFVCLVLVIVPRFIDAFLSLGLSAPAPLRWLSAVGQTSEYWWLAGPIALGLFGIAWTRSGTAARFQSASWSWLKLFPWMRSILTNYEGANFCELLALLLEHDVTYPVALKLAAESTGNPRLVRGAHSLSEAIRRGESVPRALEATDQRAFLPMLRWVLATGQEQGSLARALRNLSGHYRKRGKYLADKLAVFLPAFITVLIGACVGLFYALAVFIPIINLLGQLSTN
jgi:type II secretory pathway component PulF